MAGFKEQSKEKKSPTYYDRDQPTYKPLEGRLVKVFQQGGLVIVGWLETTDAQASYLRPSLVNESINEENRNFRIEEIIPTVVNNLCVLNMQPVKESYLRRILDSGENSCQLGLDFGEKNG